MKQESFEEETKKHRFVAEKLILEEAVKNFEKYDQDCMGNDVLVCFEWSEQGIMSRHPLDHNYKKEIIVDVFDQIGEPAKGSDDTLWRLKTSNDVQCPVRIVHGRPVDKTHSWSS